MLGHTCVLPAENKSNANLCCGPQALAQEDRTLSMLEHCARANMVLVQTCLQRAGTKRTTGWLQLPSSCCMQA